MSQKGEPASAIRLAITPEPTDEEVAAIAAVVAALVASSGGREVEQEPESNRWARAGRQEALRGPLWPADDAHNVRA